jgi:hypothetical protein
MPRKSHVIEAGRRERGAEGQVDVLPETVDLVPDQAEANSLVRHTVELYRHRFLRWLKTTLWQAHEATCGYRTRPPLNWSRILFRIE